MNRRTGRARPLLLLCLVAGLAAACSPGDPAAPAPATSAPVTDRSAPPARAVVTERTVRVAGVPQGYQAFIEFADARHGYALFSDCPTNGPCRGGLLFASADGGATWQPRPVPDRDGHNLQLYVDGPQQLSLWSETNGYHLSRDGGRTYTFAREVPRDHRAATGVPFGVEYTSTEAVLTDYRTGKPVPLPDGYQGGGATVTRDGTIWLTRFDKGRETARSTDGGVTWQRLAVPEQPGRQLFALFVRVSPTGDAWLIGEQDPMSSLGGGTSLLGGSVLKGTGLPLVWQLTGGAWRPRPIEGIREQPNHPYSVAPAGSGLLAIAGPEGVGYLADRYVAVPGTPRLDWIGVLPDGTLFGRQNVPGRIHLGRGDGWQREWVELTLM
ncbi:WD40/YVTN/BNR-like repeat-containing protein [Catellatospora bangladeshensis]|uniref:Exo-alpha-sialidase n=2 Tax=Catellatospora bangladeshensis TaxID=310355 RepID=A0A8J3NKX0_9ACTN|nr:hypothetical protein [Catellatospora bangladeshensis]GIF84447.1 hypothetical protein Cba03nite_57960 [Catellatospora bangladeshensis]